LRQGYAAEDIRTLNYFFDWLLRLPSALAEQAHAALHAAEEELHMTYITTHERIGIAKGRAEGLVEGRAEGLVEGLVAGLVLALEIKFGVAAEDVIAKLATIDDLAVLEALKDGIRTATSIDQVRAILEPPTAA
jgi:flagellar biosynthesis/type III secretory pathway protein FliH